ncbi:MAG TPA: type II toxin-antitoxin system RelE/ParE family toxin [Candidatus Nanoarchaeia archaeon]|nr:type II toxin-antitoxin system RelE/ParE family toxin [Candidatus Nanoarchaeia archaeon]
MTYEWEVHQKCQEEIEKSCKTNPVLGKVLRNKMDEIVQNPSRYKHLRYDLAGERRVHIMKSFVLKFEIDENKKKIMFLSFKHHDEAYRR